MAWSDLWELRNAKIGAFWKPQLFDTNLVTLLNQYTPDAEKKWLQLFHQFKQELLESADNKDVRAITGLESLSRVCKEICELLLAIEFTPLPIHSYGPRQIARMVASYDTTLGNAPTPYELTRAEIIQDTSWRAYNPEKLIAYLWSELEKLPNPNKPPHPHPLPQTANAAIPAVSQIINWCESVQSEAVEGQQSSKGDERIEPEIAHSLDFRSVLWGSESFSFTPKQAPVIRLLYQALKNKTPDIGGETLLNAVDPEAPPERMDKLFSGHKAWKTMIVPGGSKGTYRLQVPENNP